MSWIGQNQGQWQNAEAEADADFAAGRAGHANREAREWKAYAEKLQETISELNAMYRRKVGDELAQAALKDLALDELQKLDPSNKLLNPEFRQQIGKKVREDTKKGYEVSSKAEVEPAPIQKTRKWSFGL